MKDLKKMPMNMKLLESLMSHSIQSNKSSPLVKDLLNSVQPHNKTFINQRKNDDTTHSLTSTKTFTQKSKSFKKTNRK